MSIFSDYMDKVTAGDELKQNTKAYVGAALSSSERSKKPHTKTRRFTSLAAVAACAVLIVAGYYIYNTPVKYVSLDINPSVELSVNRFDRVLGAEAYNDDGTLLLGDYDFKNDAVGDALGTLVQKASELGFIADDGTTVVSLTAESDSESAAENLGEKVRESVEAALESKNIPAVVFCGSSSLELREQAREYGISPGKYRLILALQSLDPSISLEDYRNAKVTDIILKGNELMQQSGKSGDLSEIFEQIGSAAAQVRAAQEKAGQNSGSDNDNGGQSENNGQAAENGTAAQNGYTGSDTQEQNKTESDGTGAADTNGVGSSDTSGSGSDSSGGTGQKNTAGGGSQASPAG